MNPNLKSVLRKFGHGGPYNPLRYKTNLVPRSYPKDKEIEEAYMAHHQIPMFPVRNMRHINPIRQSGPLPAYDGPYPMEDIRKIPINASFGGEQDGLHHDPEEIMRRVPGITRKEAEFITTLGLNPDEEIDYAYIAHNIGLDIFYEPNAIYLGR